MERERIVSEQRNIHDFQERKAEQAFQGESAAQTRVSEAQSELEKRERKMHNADLLFLKMECRFNPRVWNSFRLIK